MEKSTSAREIKNDPIKGSGDLVLVVFLPNRHSPVGKIAIICWSTHQIFLLFSTHYACGKTEMENFPFVRLITEKGCFTQTWGDGEICSFTHIVIEKGRAWKVTLSYSTFCIEF